MGLKQMLIGLFGQKPIDPIDEQPPGIDTIYTDCLYAWLAVREAHVKGIYYGTLAELPKIKYYDFAPLLMQWISGMRTDVKAPRELFELSFTRQTLDDFFITKQNTYGDTNRLMLEFCDLIIELCQVTIETNDEQFGAIAYNRRNGSLVIDQLHQVAKVIIA